MNNELTLIAKSKKQKYHNNCQIVNIQKERVCRNERLIK